MRCCMAQIVDFFVYFESAITSSSNITREILWRFVSLSHIPVYVFLTYTFESRLKQADRQTNTEKLSKTIIEYNEVVGGNNNQWKK